MYKQRKGKLLLRKKRNHSIKIWRETNINHEVPKISDFTSRLGLCWVSTKCQRGSKKKEDWGAAGEGN